MRRLIVTLTLMLPLAGTAGYEDGMAAYNRGDYAQAIAEIEPLAENGNTDAEYIMGMMFHYGYGKELDQAQAAAWFRKAANGGNAQAQYYLGMINEKGDGVPRDLVAAHMWYSLSAATTKNHRDSLYAKKAARELEKSMKAEDIARARQMAAEHSVQN